VITFDLHANLSPRMIAFSTAAIGYRSNPHLDQHERGEEAARVLSRILREGIRPVQALESPPMIIRNSRQHTGRPPAAALYDDLGQVLARPGIYSASIAMGFPHADVAEMGPGFLAVAESEAVAREAAQWMTRRAWERRAEFSGPLASIEEAVRRAAEASQGPVVLLDTGDNVGGGSAATSTVLFDELIRQRVPSGLIVLHDPTAVSACLAAGIRNEVAIDTPPVRGRVRLIADGLFEETKVRHGGWSRFDQGITAVVETKDDHTLVFTSRRMAPFSLEQLISLGIHPERKRVMIVKGVIAPRAAYDPVAAETILVDTPGATADDPARLQYQHRRKPMYPLEPYATYLND
jgi:microcystin degradation protein MlrC